MVYYSGCNVNINNNTLLRSALAMHECGNCKRLSYCKLKQTSEIFAYTIEIAQKMDDEWKEMIKSRGGGG